MYHVLTTHLLVCGVNMARTNTMSDCMDIGDDTKLHFGDRFVINSNRRPRTRRGPDMSKMKPVVTILVCIALLAGCSVRSGFETTPVEVQTAKGVVTCQLYTNRRVLWDEAISMPSSMGTQEANGICRAEGQRRLENSR